MKNSIFYFVMLAFTGLLSYSSYGGNPDANKASENKSNYSFSIGCSEDLHILTQSWVNGYNLIEPDISINLSTEAGEKGIQILTRKELSNKKELQTWHMVIGKKVFVPIINTNNPIFGDLTQQGITDHDLRNLLAVGQQESASTGKISTNFYLPNDPEILELLSAYLKLEVDGFKANLAGSEDEVINAIQNDVNAIGFCSLEAVIVQDRKGFRNNISLVPIDKNNNGRLDYFEKIYGSLDEFLRGVWIGKYPNQLIESIYASSATTPGDDEKTFLKWVITDGQSELLNNGLVYLTGAEAKKGLELISVPIDNELFLAENKESQIAIIIIAFLIIGLIGGGVVRYILWNRRISKETDIQLSGGLNESVIEAPKGIFFDKSHTWAYLEQDGSVKVGVDDFLQHLTGPLTRIKMKENGETVRKGEKFLTIMRNGKQLDLYSPVSGVITEKNASLVSNTRLINISPYSEGWVYRIEPKNWMREIEFLTLSSGYKEWLNTEFSRLKDFFSETVKSNDSAYNHIVLQDGGELADNILADLDPYVWEDFQRHFIDISK